MIGGGGLILPVSVVIVGDIIPIVRIIVGHVGNCEGGSGLG